MSKVTIITASTGKPELLRCINSVKNQTFTDVQHLVFADGPDAEYKISSMGVSDVDVISLPYPTGNNRWNGHRMYGAGTYLANDTSEYVMFLDDDNYIDPDHIQNCLDVIPGKSAYRIDWAYSLRKIVTVSGDYICNDDCESLGKWASVCHYQDFFIDVNCYFLPRAIAIQMSPVWYCKFREPGQPEIDRKMAAFLMNNYPRFDCTYKYSVNYAVASNSQLSVKPEFFLQGNKIMLDKYQGNLPWAK
jgi:glycosyltransferase involved in cell wall biosynthesis